MSAFLNALKDRNLLLYYFGWFCLVGTLVCALLVATTQTRVLGVKAWFKPLKFFLSTCIFAWTMGWLLFDLKEESKVAVYSWMVVGVLAFETLYIALQAAWGQLSHFNVSSPGAGFMFMLMGAAITVLTLWTGYIGYLFFQGSFADLSAAYLWGIRLGIVFFVLFALQGGIMGSRMAHTVGAADGGPGLPLVNWSTRYGDLRIAHFLGMHALQLLPLLSFYVLRSVKMTFIVAALYFILCAGLLIQALLGRPLIRL